MKLEVKLGDKIIGELQVSTIPGISHKFVLDNVQYQIIKTSKTTLEVQVYQSVVNPEVKKDEKK